MSHDASAFGRDGRRKRANAILSVVLALSMVLGMWPQGSVAYAVSLLDADVDAPVEVHEAPEADGLVSAQSLDPGQLQSPDAALEGVAPVPDPGPETFSIVFEPNGPTQGEDVVTGAMEPFEFVMDGEVHALPKAVFGRGGHRFVGWSLTRDGRDVADDPATEADESFEALLIPDGLEMSNLGYDEVIEERHDNGDGTETVTSRSCPRNLEYAAKDHVITLYAQWEVERQEAEQTPAEGATQADEAPVSNDAKPEAPEAAADGEPVTEPGVEVSVSGTSEDDGVRGVVVKGDVSDVSAIASALESSARMDRGAARSGAAQLMGALAKSVPAEDPDVPRQLDGSFIENITVEWVTEDSDGDDGDASRLYVRPPNNNPFRVRAVVDYALSGEHDYGEGDVSIRIPARVFVNRDGSDGQTWVYPYPQETSASDDFMWSYSGDEIVFTNTHTLPAASKGYIELDMTNIVPSAQVDMALTEPLWARIEVSTHRGNLIGLSSEEIYAQVDTEERVLSANKHASSVKVVTADEIPEAARVPGETEYLVIDWSVSATLKGNTEFVLESSDTLTDEYNGRIISTRGFGQRTVSWDEWQGWRGGNSDGSASAVMGTESIRVAYPFSQFEPDTKYRFTNEVDYTLTEVDPERGDDPQLVTHAHAEGVRTWSWTMPNFVDPPGHFMVQKYGNDGSGASSPNYSHSLLGTRFHDSLLANESRVWYGIYPSAINDLMEDTDVEISYTLDTTGFMLPWTLREGGDARVLGDYGQRPVRMVTTDIDETQPGAVENPQPAPFHMGGTPLELGVDYDYRAVEFSMTPRLYKARAINLNPDGSFSVISAGDGKVEYERDLVSANIPDVSLEAKVAGTWQSVAVASWKSGRLTITPTNGALVDGIRVYLPIGTEQIRTTVETSVAGLEYHVRPVYVVYATGAVRAAAEEIFAESDTATVNVTNTTYMRAYDADGEELVDIHKFAYDQLAGYNTDVAVTPSKSAQDKGYDAEQRHSVIGYTGEFLEQSRIPDLAIWEDAVADGKMVEERRGRFYDLLPRGMRPILSTIELREGDTILDVQTVDDWHGSGRVMLIVDAELEPHLALRDGGYGVPTVSDLLRIRFDATYPAEAMVDYGTETHNVIAYESLSRDPLGNVENYGAEPDDPRSSNNIRTADAFVSEAELDAMGDLDPQNVGERFVYAGVTATVDAPSAARTSLSKNVRVNDEARWSQGTYEDKRTVWEGGVYEYRLRMMSDRRTISRDLIMYDSLENFRAADGNDSVDIDAPRWRGELVSVDTRDLEASGCAPVVYYSVEDNLALADEHDPRMANATNTDLSNTDIWVKADDYTGDLSDVHAIAIDCTRRSDGTPFELQPLESAVAYVHMHAPSGEPAREYISQKGEWGDSAHAYNNIYLTCTSIDSTTMQADGDNFVRHDYTKVGLKEFRLNVTKQWDDDLDRDGLRPESVDVHLMANGRDSGKVVTLSAPEWSGSFENIPYTDDAGKPIHYTMREDAPSGYRMTSSYDENDHIVTNRHVPERVRLAGTKTWEGGEGHIPSHIRLTLYSDGRAVATKHVTADSLGNWSYDFGEYSRYRDHGTEIVYTVKESDVEPAWIATYDGLDTHNEYHPFGEIHLSKTTVGDTATNDGKRFSFAVSLTDGEGAALVGSYEYETSDGRTGAVSNGGTITLADGESATIHEVPEHARYEFVEDIAAGYATTSSGASGEVVANATAEASFVNTYHARGVVSLGVEKTLTGHAMLRNHFKFCLYDADGNLVRTALNKPDGTATFGGIEYREGDVRDEPYVYRIVEEARGRAGYTYDEREYVAYVSVRDLGNGTLATSVRYEDADGHEVSVPSFANEYHASGSHGLRAWKVLDGRKMAEGEFTFELLDESGERLGTARNTATGDVVFDELDFDERDAGKTYHYLVREVAGDDDTVVYDDATFGYELRVFDNDDGTLSFEQAMVEASVDAGTGEVSFGERVDSMPVFSNGLADGGLRVEKHVTGDVPESHVADEFRFRVKFTGDDVPESVTWEPHELGAAPAGAIVPADALSSIADAFVSLFEPRRAYAVSDGWFSDSSHPGIEWTVDGTELVIRPVDGAAEGGDAGSSSWGWTSAYSDAYRSGLLPVSGPGEITDVRFEGIVHVSHTNNMFANMVGLRHADLTGLDTSSADTMYCMFEGDSALESVNLTGIRTDTVRYMYRMFKGCSSLKSVDVSGFSMESCTEIYDMFQGCSSLESVRMFSCANLGYMSAGRMFSGCSSLTSIDLSDWHSETDRAYFGDFFEGCSSLSEVILGPDSVFACASPSGQLLLPTPPLDTTTGKWVNYGTGSGPYAPSEFRDAYDGSVMSGVWEWQRLGTTVSFNANGGSGAMRPQTIAGGSTERLQDPRFVRFGYRLVGWNSEPDGSGTDYAIDAEISSAPDAIERIALYAQWEELERTVTLEDGSFELSMPAGHAFSIADLPANLGYQVFEETEEGWVLVSQSGTSGTIRPTVTSVASFTNTYDEARCSVSLFGFKTLDGRGADARAFAFELREGGTVIERVRNAAGGAIDFSPIEYDESSMGTHVYEVSETVGGDDGIVYDTHIETVTVEVSKVGDNLVAQVLMDADGVSFANETKPGAMEIRKSTDGGGNPDEEFEFEVELKGVTASVGSGSGVVDIIGWLGSLLAPRVALAADDGWTAIPYSDCEWRLFDGGELVIRPEGGGISGSFDDPRPSYLAGLSNSIKETMSSDQISAVRSISFEGSVSVSSCHYLIASWPSLESVDLSGLATSAVTDFSNMFEYCPNLRDVDFGGIDTSSGTSFNSMFNQCMHLGDIDLRGLDFSACERVQYLFYSSDFKSVDLSGLTLVRPYQLFGYSTDRDTTVFADGLKIVSSVLEVDAFRFLTATDVTLINLDLSECVGLENFLEYGAVEHVRMSTSGQSAVTTMREMFFGNGSYFKSVDFSGFDTSNVTNMYNLFGNMDNLESVDLSGFDFSKLTNASNMFYDCNNLTEIVLGNAEMPSLVYATNMFSYSPKLQHIYVADGVDWSGNSGLQAGNAFYDTTLLEGGAGTRYAEIAGSAEGPNRMPAQYMRVDGLGGRPGLFTAMGNIVRFDANGGGVVSGRSEYRMVDGNYPVAVPVVARGGYVFAGWNSLRDGTGTDYGRGPVVRPPEGGSLTLYAQWVPEEDAVAYNVVHKQEKGDGSGEFVEVGTEVRYALSAGPVTVAPNSYGGFVTPEAQTVDVVADGSTTITFEYLRKRINVTYVMDDGSRVVREVLGGVRSTLEDAPEIDGKRFVGWMCGEGGRDGFFADGQRVSFVDDVVLYAKYVGANESYTPMPNRTIRVKVRAGETVRLDDLPAGATYEVREVNVPDGWHEVSISGASGVIGANSTVSVVATNAYEASGSVDIVAHKELLGGELREGAFSFELLDGAGNVIATTTNGGPETADNVLDPTLDVVVPNPNKGLGIVAFRDVPLTRTGVVSFAIREVPGPDKVIDYDGHLEMVTVEVTDDGHGRLHGRVVEDLDGATFTNRVRPPEERSYDGLCGDLRLSKEVEGGLATQAFIYDVYAQDSDGIPLTGRFERRVEGGDGTLTLHRSDIWHTPNVNDLGERLSEWGADERFAGGVVSIPGAERITLDVTYPRPVGSFHIVHGSVENDPFLAHDGNWSWPDAYYEFGYTDMYYPDDGSGQYSTDYFKTPIHRTLTVEGDSATLFYRAPTTLPDRYNFGWYPNGVWESLYDPYWTNYGAYVVASGDVHVPGEEAEPIVFVDGHATVEVTSEHPVVIEGLPAGATYHVSEQEQFGWEQVGATGTDGTIARNRVAEASFANRYFPEGSFELRGTKRALGFELADDMFEFELYDEDGNLFSSARCASDGSIVFGDLPIEAEWAQTTRRFRIVEVAGSDPDIIYDDHIEEVEVSFTDDGAGHLAGSVVTDADGITFTNELVIVHMPGTGLGGIPFSTTLYGTVAVAVALAAMVRRRRRGRARHMA